MGYYTGTHGGVYIRTAQQNDNANNTQIFHIRNWQFTTSISQLDATTLGDTDKVPVNGIRTTRGSCTVLYYKDATNVPSTQWFTKRFLSSRKPDSNQKADWDCARPGVGLIEAEPMWLRLYIDSDAPNNSYINMQVNVTSFAMSCAVGDIISANIQFEQVGASLQVTNL